MPKEVKPVARLAEHQIVPKRSRALHWLAWLGAIASFAMLLAIAIERPGDARLEQLAWVDGGIALFFALEFFTRSGWKQERAAYLAWRWFDFFAMIPVIVLMPYDYWGETFLLWLVLVCRGIRVTDRTLGDGFVQRHLLALVGAFEEEITDRVTIRILTRVEEDLGRAKLGSAAAKALSERKKDLLDRIYKEQFKDAGAAGALAHFTGLQAALERAEAQIFDAVIEVVGSPETDEMIRAVLSETLSRTRTEMGKKAWRSQVGLRKRAPA